LEALGLLTDQPCQFSKIQHTPLQFNAPIRSPRQQICFERRDLLAQFVYSSESPDSPETNEFEAL